MTLPACNTHVHGMHAYCVCLLHNDDENVELADRAHAIPSSHTIAHAYILVEFCVKFLKYIIDILLIKLI